MLIFYTYIFFVNRKIASQRAQKATSPESGQLSFAIVTQVACSKPCNIDKIFLVRLKRNKSLLIPLGNLIRKTMIMAKVTRLEKKRTKGKGIHLQKKRMKGKEIHLGMTIKRKRKKRLLEIPSVQPKMKKKVMMKVLEILSVTMMVMMMKKVRTKMQEILSEMLMVMQTKMIAPKNLAKSLSPLL